MSSPQPVLSAAVNYLEPEVVASWPDIVAYVDYDENVNVVYSNPVAASDYTCVDAALSFIEAYSITSWLDVGVVAQSTMPDVLTAEVVSPVDELAFYFTKSLNDFTPGFIDSTTVSFLKSNADSVTLVDDTDIDYWIDKRLFDSQGFADAVRFSLVKAPFTDEVFAASTTVLQPIKNLADSIGAPTDFVVRTFYKSLADSVTLTEAVSVFKAFIRDFSDTLSTPDRVYLQPEQPKTDSASATDATSLTGIKNVSDSIFLLDNMDGDIEYVFIKLVSELLIASDTSNIAFTAEKVDNLSTVSSGILTIQDYCDITYFLEDYVGSSRTFT